jgi:hypothetical protein
MTNDQNGFWPKKYTQSGTVFLEPRLRRMGIMRFGIKHLLLLTLASAILVDAARRFQSIGALLGGNEAATAGQRDLFVLMVELAPLTFAMLMFSTWLRSLPRFSAFASGRTGTAK